MVLGVIPLVVYCHYMTMSGFSFGEFVVEGLGMIRLPCGTLVLRWCFGLMTGIFCFRWVLYAFFARFWGVVWGKLGKVDESIGKYRKVDESWRKLRKVRHPFVVSLHRLSGANMMLLRAGARSCKAAYCLWGMRNPLTNPSKDRAGSDEWMLWLF